MARITVTTASGDVWHIHKYAGGPKVRPDRDGRTTGYRCTPPGSNRSEDAVSFETTSDAAAFLLGNRGWGARFSPNGTDSPQSIFSESIQIDGVLR
ncbi:hypothetical protein HNP73_000579 [Amaricoccus macauensis]|uniref:Uncharacterized protein n=1 Tax=Amaricoccus macauensis TaxID=57001 RepID=A0A840SKH1_9RHOB|nr:hypothetical protein [Amaricoccus macauensis]